MIDPCNLRHMIDVLHHALKRRPLQRCRSRRKILAVHLQRDGVGNRLATLAILRRRLLRQRLSFRRRRTPHFAPHIIHKRRVEVHHHNSVARRHRAQLLIGQIPRRTRQRPRARVRRNHRRVRRLHHIPERLVRDVAHIHHHPQPVHLAHHLAPEVRQPVVVHNIRDHRYRPNCPPTHSSSPTSESCTARPAGDTPAAAPGCSQSSAHPRSPAARKIFPPHARAAHPPHVNPSANSRGCFRNCSYTPSINCERAMRIPSTPLIRLHPDREELRRQPTMPRRLQIQMTIAQRPNKLPSLVDEPLRRIRMSIDHDRVLQLFRQQQRSPPAASLFVSPLNSARRIAAAHTAINTAMSP